MAGDGGGAPLGLGLGIAAGQGVAGSNGALLDADFIHGRYAFAGQVFASETAFLAAVGGSRSAGARIIGPRLVGADLLADGHFAAGTLDGWASTPANTGNGSVSVVANQLRCDINSASGGYRAARSLATVAGRAYLFAGDFVARGAAPPLTGIAVNFSTNADLGGSDTRFGTAAGGLPQHLDVVGGTAGATAYVGLVLSATASTPASSTWDDFSVKEVLPYSGYVPGSLAFSLAGVAPAVASGTKVALQWGTDGERYRIRVAWDASRHLRLVVTANAAEQANLDLGLVELSTAFRLEASIGANRIVARLRGGGSIVDTAAIMPSVGRLWVGRSFTGEAWDGSIDRLTVWAGERVPDDLLYLEGDSYAAGSGGVSLGTALVATAGRGLFTTAVGGSTPTQQLARIVANPGLARGTLLVWDGDANTGAVVADMLAAYAGMVAALHHERYLIVPPCRRANKTGPDNANVTTLQQALAATYPGHVVDAQAVLAAHATLPGDAADVAAGTIPTSLLQGDATHLTATGMGHVATAVAAALSARGW